MDAGGPTNHDLDPALLERNLAALALGNPGVAERLRSVAPAGLSWAPSKVGPLTAAVTPADGGRPVQLCSRYDPVKEAAALLKPLDDADTAAGVLLGLGVGHHAAEAHRRLGPQALMIVFEPDPAQLVDVLGRVDHTAWLATPNVVVFTGEADGGPDATAVNQRLEAYAATLTQGVTLLPHPPTRGLHPEAVGRFAEHLSAAVAYCRTNVATALVISAKTARNQAVNLGAYYAGAGTDDLHGAAAGTAAVCVAAGPSLAKNADLLRDTDVRRRVTVVAAQTALKPLLQRGVRPDYVTALDYSPICARFYEGLPPLPDVTLVAEPKANPAILAAFPGPVRLIPSAFCDRVLAGLGGAGSDADASTGHRVPLKSGSTVAHLSLYLAEHLGCDPILMIGQDLGFSDGLYYCPGTAVHEVWDCELNAFNTLENLEWLRIARMGANLARREDVHGRTLFSDEQMLTYLKQFERDFAAAEAAGRTILDCTEGGMPKAHARAVPLAEALGGLPPGDAPRVPPPPTALDAKRLEALRQALEARASECVALAGVCREAADTLRKLQRRLDDEKRRLTLKKTLDRLKGRVNGDLADVFALVNQMNTLGAFRRRRADRRISQTTPAAGRDKMRAQLERDLENMTMMGEAAADARGILREAREAAGGTGGAAP